jgi:hypothetical protein
MIRAALGRSMKIVIVSLCGALLFLAFAPAWAQPRPGRPVPNVFPHPAEEGDPNIPPPGRAIRVVPEMVPYGVPVEPDQFESETMELIDAYRQATDDKSRANVRTKLVAHLAQKFDSQHQRREKEIKDLKDRLKQLAEVHAKRAADRKGIIDRHADHLLREVDGLGWEHDAPTFVEERVPTW